MARIRKVYGETLSMSTTAAHAAVPINSTEIMHYATSDYRLGVAPVLDKVFYYSASAGTYTDYTDYARDKDSSTHVPLDGMVATDILYMGFSECPRGVYIDMGSNVNANAATLDVEFYNGTAWTDVSSDSDGTTSGGATLAQDGLYSWTLPTSIPITVNGVSSLQWIRFKPSTTLSATVDVNEIIPACIDTNYGYFRGGGEYAYPIDKAKVGAIETDMASGTATLQLTYFRT